MPGILGNQNLDTPGVTSFIYMLPLGGQGMGKPWGSSDRGFPCCWGTLSEQLSKMADSIYFQSPPTPGSGPGSGAPPAIYVNLFVSSTVAFAAGGVSIVQESKWPVSPNGTTTLTIAPLLPTSAPNAFPTPLVEAPAASAARDASSASAGATRFTIHLRVPIWATLGPNSVRINGKPVRDKPVPGSYLALTRDWRAGDTVVADFPMPFGAVPLEDDRPAFNATYAYTFGPLVLTGLTSTRWFVPDGAADDPQSFITRVHDDSKHALQFEAKGKLLVPAPPSLGASSVPVREPSAMRNPSAARGGGEHGHGLDGGSSMRMLPLLSVMSEKYTVYFDTAIKTVPFAARGATVPSDALADFGFTSGASGTSGPKDASTSGANIRSGNPHATSRVQLDHPLLAPGYSIDSLALHFRYCAGYTPPPGKAVNASIVRVLLTDESGVVLSTVFTSQPLGNYSYDHFKGYSPRIAAASASPLGVANDGLVFIVLEVANRDRNLQIPIDDLSGGFNATVTWTKRGDAEGHAHHGHHLHVHSGGVAHDAHGGEREHEHVHQAFGGGEWWR